MVIRPPVSGGNRKDMASTVVQNRTAIAGLLCLQTYNSSSTLEHVLANDPQV